MVAPSEAKFLSRAKSDPGPKTKKVHAPEEARQGQVVLKGPRQRWTFFAGIAGAIILTLVIALTIA